MHLSRKNIVKDLFIHFLLNDDLINTNAIFNIASNDCNWEYQIDFSEKLNKTKHEYDLLNSFLNKEISIKTLFDEVTFLTHLCLKYEIDIPYLMAQLEIWKEHEYNQYLFTYWINKPLNHLIFDYTAENVAYQNPLIKNVFNFKHNGKIVENNQKSQFFTYSNRMAALILIVFQMPTFVSQNHVYCYDNFDKLKNNVKTAIRCKNCN